MKPEDILIRIKDGAEITAPLYRPESDSPTSTNNTNAKKDTLFLCLPAMGVKAAYYKPLAETLSGRGYSVLLCDLRGQGTSNRKAPDDKFGYTLLLECDLFDYVGAAKKACPDKKVVLLGHSLGGHLSLLYASAKPDSVAAVAVVASGSVYWKAYSFPQNLKTIIGTQSSVLVSTLCGYFPGHKIGFGGKQPKQMMRDWAWQGRTGHFQPKDASINYELAMEQYQKPIFALSIEGDTLAPHSATDHLVSKMKNALVHRVYYRKSTALESKIDHFQWVKHSDGIVTELSQWEQTL